MNRLRRIFLFLVPLWAACGTAPPPSLHLVKKVAVDESVLVLKSLPRKVSLINDSTAALLADGKIATYDLNTGKLIRSFERLAMNLDSLVRNTFGKGTEDSIGYITIGGHLLDEPEYGNMISMFDYSDNQFTILCAVPIEYRYKNSDALTRMLRSSTAHDTAQLHALLRDSSLLLHTTQVSFCPFFVKTDAQFHVQSVVPYYLAATPKTRYGQYIALIDFGFQVDGDTLYCRANNQEAAFSNLPDEQITSADSMTLLGSLLVNKHEARWAAELLNTSQIPDYRRRAMEYARLTSTVCRTNGKRLTLTESGVYALPSRARFHTQPVLHDSESVYGDFDAGENWLLYMAGHLPTKLTEPGKPLASHLRLSDQNNTVIADTVATTTISFGKLDHRYLFVMRNGDQYYFMRYEIR